VIQVASVHIAQNTKKATMLHIVTLATGILYLLNQPDAPTSLATHCASPESVVFSCEVEDGRTVSICERSADEKITFRFGRLGRVETAATDHTGLKSVFFASTHRAAPSTYAQVGLRNDGYEFIVYLDQDDGEPTPRSGLVILNMSAIDEPLHLGCEGRIVEGNIRFINSLPCKGTEQSRCD
jgi:hypothetical protein